MYVSYLVLAGPEGTDGDLYLLPLSALRAGHVPRGISPRSAVHPHVHAQTPGTVSIPAVEKITELQTVCVVLTQRT